jgi:hypothetical protein
VKHKKGGVETGSKFVHILGVETESSFVHPKLDLVFWSRILFGSRFFFESLVFSKGGLNSPGQFLFSHLSILA